MGILVNRVFSQIGMGFTRIDALRAMEQAVMRKAPAVLDQLASGRAELSTRIIEPNNRSGDIRIIDISSETGQRLSYGVKSAQSSIEAGICVRASVCQCGPELLAIFGSGIESTIVEEIYPKEWNYAAHFRDQPRPEWGKTLGNLFLRFFDFEMTRLLDHADANYDHPFYVEAGKARELRLIDWGSARYEEFSRLEEWAENQAALFETVLGARDVKDEFLATLENAERTNQLFRQIHLLERLHTIDSTLIYS